MSGDYTKINSMSKDELREFVLFVCTAYPTLLEALAAHEKHTQFAKDHPDKTPHRTTTHPDQLELPFL